MGSTRLPGKAMADIGGKPMIAHVVARALAARLGPVVVATDAQEIADVVRPLGVGVAMTRTDCPSGSDRIYEALEQIDPHGRHDVVVNVQGDMPTLDPRIIPAALDLLHHADVDIATLAAPVVDVEELQDPAVVKIALAGTRALYFSRTPIPYGAGPHYHHIGIYAYRRPALKRFVSLPPSPLETAEKLEQLRALEAGMRVDVALVQAVPLGVDTPEGLEKARKAVYDDL